jgi:hypothetical protein
MPGTTHQDMGDPYELPTVQTNKYNQEPTITQLCSSALVMTSNNTVDETTLSAHKERSREAQPGEP